MWAKLIRNPKVAGRSMETGFTLVEVLVAGLLLVVGLLMVAHFFTSVMGRVLESDVRSVLHQVASREVEYIRGLPYDQVGTTNGHPQGVLAEEEIVQVEGFKALIHRDISYYTDPSYSGPYPANYRRVTVTVTANGYAGIGPVEMTTNVAGGAPGGTLDITVTDSRGDPVPNARITITNTHLIPPVNLQSSALRTDSRGHLFVPGLPPDTTPSYTVSASKQGYNTDYTDPAVVVQDGVATVVQLIIDHLSSMTIGLKDTEGTEVPGLRLSMVGPYYFANEYLTVEGGIDLSDLPFSTDLDPYIVRLLPGQGYDPQDQHVVLEAGNHEDVLFVVPAGGPTTTLPASSSLTVRVMARSTKYPYSYQPVSRAQVRITGKDWISTNSNGYAYFYSLANGDYTLEVQKSGYQNYRATVTVYKSTSVEARVERR